MRTTTTTLIPLITFNVYSIFSPAFWRRNVNGIIRIRVINYQFDPIRFDWIKVLYESVSYLYHKHESPYVHVIGAVGHAGNVPVSGVRDETLVETIEEPTSEKITATAELIGRENSVRENNENDRAERVRTSWSLSTIAKRAQTGFFCRTRSGFSASYYKTLLLAVVRGTRLKPIGSLDLDRQVTRPTH